MNKYLRLFRLGNGIMGFLAVFIGAWIAVGTDIVDFVPQLILGCAIVLAFIAGGNALNDYIDREIDVVGHPDRPIPRGEITPQAARNCGISGLAIACVLSLLYLDAACIAIVLLACVLMIAYEYGLKQSGFMGNVTIAALTGMVFLLTGAIVGDTISNVVVALLAAIVSVGREIAKDIEDMESDEGQRRTLPMTLGARKAGYIASFCLALGPALSLVPIYLGQLGVLYLTVLASDAIFIYCAWVLSRDPHKCEKLAKVAMFVALIAFILGAI